MPALHSTSTAARFCGRGIAGLGLLGLNSLLDPRLFGAASTASHGVVNPLHIPPRRSASSTSTWPAARRTWRPSTTSRSCAEMHGKPMPESFTKGQPIAQLQGKTLICFGPQHGFKKFGKSGQEICELFPHIGSVADDICIIRSMRTERSTTTRPTRS